MAITNTDRRVRDTVRREPARRGIALLDVIVGTVMLAIGLAVVISLTSRSLVSQTDGEKRLVASWLADELLAMVVVEGPEDYPKLYDTSGRFAAPFAEYTYDLNIEYTGVITPFRVTATIGWASGDREQQIQVQTMIAPRREEVEEEEETLRAPSEPLDRETRDYERIFGSDEEASQEVPADA